MTNSDDYLEPCKECILKMCCSQVCQKFIDYVEKEFQLAYSKQKFPVPMNMAREHIMYVKNGLVCDYGSRISEYERRD